MSKPAKVFLNYSRDDELAVSALFNRLSAEGYEPWMDKKSIVGGEEWRESIMRGIRECDVFVACLSPRSVNKRGFIQREIKYALDKWQEMTSDDIFLIPVRLEPCTIPFELEKFEYVDLFEEDGLNRLLRALREALKRRNTR